MLRQLHDEVAVRASSSDSSRRSGEFARLATPRGIAPMRGRARTTRAVMGWDRTRHCADDAQTQIRIPGALAAEFAFCAMAAEQLTVSLDHALADGAGT